MRRLTIRFLAAIAILIALGYVAGHVPAVQDAILRRAAQRTLASGHDELLADDGLRVVLCGTGVPLADRARANACTAVFAGGQFFLVDVGPGAWKNLALWRLPADKIAGVLLTHFHSDHIGDLGELNMQTWAAGRAHPLQVYGPPGVEQVVAGFAQAYALDEGYRVAHHGAALMAPENWKMEAHPVTIATQNNPCSGGEATVLSDKDLTITAFTVDHSPVAPAYGYRFDYRGRSVAISGDTIKCDNLIRHAAGADVLIHEAQSANIAQLIGGAAAEVGRARIAKIMHDIQRYHTTPVEAAEIANQARVKLLIFSHVGPVLPNLLARWTFLRGVSSVRNRGLLLGYDGMLVTLPAGSDTIGVSSLN